MVKIHKISGFPELLPNEKLMEDRIISSIKSIFELYGFSPIETRAVEPISYLSGHGDDKEIFAIRRATDDSSSSTEEQLGLHFDLTLPFARYVAENFSKIKFPFKRYQLQKVWRGERPQRGRFREFYQFDLDVIGAGELPLAAEAEILTVFAEVFAKFNIGKIKISVSNRKILYGALEASNIPLSQFPKVFTVVDKIHKIGHAKVASELSFLSQKTVDLILELAQINCAPAELKNVISKYQLMAENLERGVEELDLVFSLIPINLVELFKVDFSMVRGLAYYTGTVFETFVENHEEFGSIASGGRYEDLASRFIDQKLPGCGGSIGLTRLVSLILENNLIDVSRVSVTDVVVTVESEERRQLANLVAAILRENGLNVEVYLKPIKLGKQIEYAEAKSANWVFFLPITKDSKIGIKDLKTKEQQEIAFDSLPKWARQMQNLPK
ncbi:MAG TPA: histidine--tRNA ligase [Oligoflexia bacterium]|nr:histidine--tRNA ligase [Oligoflexia bacterium]HMP26949.1 histidine--tRNA ligase [Oligoflexia bacterium]